MGSSILTCTSCGVTHHKECWRENGRCAVLGCEARPRPEAPANFRRLETKLFSADIPVGWLAKMIDEPDPNSPSGSRSSEWTYPGKPDTSIYLSIGGAALSGTPEEMAISLASVAAKRAEGFKEVDSGVVLLADEPIAELIFDQRSSGRNQTLRSVVHALPGGHGSRNLGYRAGFTVQRSVRYL